MPKEISQADARRWRSLAKKSVPIAVRLLSEIRSDGWETVEGYVPIVRKFETELAYLKGRGDR